ncbi:MAG: hypothetical protein PHF25_05130 [Candidatus Margulisbacteria bacterium]|nr:hypothetical protein [Candidatus Margulisiibacteriota bacterium]
MNIEQILSNLDQKQNFDLAIDFVLKKVSQGIRGYSVKEIQNLGKIANLIYKQDKLKFHDAKVGYFSNQLVLAFKGVLQESKSADRLKDVLAYYPIPVLDGILDFYPQSRNLLKIRDYLFCAENARKEINDDFYVVQEEDISNKAIVAKVDRVKLDQEMQVCADLNEKIQQIGANSLEKILAKLLLKKQELENKMEELTEKLGPFVRSDYSPQDIQMWLEGLSDEGLVSIDEFKMDQVVECVQEYSKSNQIELNLKQDNQENADVVSEVNVFKLDIEKAENRIQKIFQTDLKKIKKQINTNKEEIAKHKETTEVQVLGNICEDEEVQVSEEKEMLQDNLDTLNNVDASHYNQRDIVSKLKDDHKKGMSI